MNLFNKNLEKASATETLAVLGMLFSVTDRAIGHIDRATELTDPEAVKLVLARTIAGQEIMKQRVVAPPELVTTQQPTADNVVSLEERRPENSGTLDIAALTQAARDSASSAADVKLYRDAA